jgi:thioesterase domain-containing protein/acyl carrier protein
MIPAVFILMDEFPRTSHGKTDRRALPACDQSLGRGARKVVEPRYQLELDLLRIWEEVLGRSSISIDNNFFELGGQSLSALRMVTQIKSSLGIELPVVVLFQEPTIERLASFLQRRLLATPYSPLVEFRASGPRMPFFCIHPAGGSVVCYRELAALLGPEQPFYGLQAPGLMSGQMPLRRIEDLAALYCAEMRAAYPDGPYLLGGWSFGAYVALEAAQQLVAAGKEVALLAIFDSTGRWVKHERQPIGIDDAKLLYKSLQLSITDEDLQDVPPEERLAYVVELGRRAQVLPADFDVEHTRRFLGLLKAHAEAEGSYALRPYAGRVALFRCEQQPVEDVADRTLGWDTIALGGIEVYDVSGNHGTLMQVPHVRDLAEKLGRAIVSILSSKVGRA